MPVTLRDVAERTGVSMRTVSNVVNGFAYVSAETRARVQQAIDELGYRPNLAARNLRGGRTGTIGLAVPELAAPYFSELSGHIIREATGHSYTAIIEQTAGELDAERGVIGQARRTHQLDGLIFSPLAIQSSDLAQMTSTIPFVLLGERVPTGSFDHVGIDNVKAAETATLHLAELGKHRIAAIGDQFRRSPSTAQYRTQGYRQGLASAGLAHRKDLTMPVEQFQRADGARAMARLLDLRQPPDAVFCYNDLLAVGALRTVLSRGLRVPQDIAIVGFDDIGDGRFSTPTLTSMSPNKAEIGRVAVEQLLRRLKGDTSAPVTHMVGCELRVGESTTGGPRPQG